MTTPEFTPDELYVVAGALRREIRHADRSRRRLLVKFGEDANTAKVDEWIGWVESAYVKLGHDPAEARGEYAHV